MAKARAEHKDHRAHRPVPGRQALPADGSGGSRAPARRGVPRGPRREDRRGVRELRDRRGHRPACRRLRSRRRRIQPVRDEPACAAPCGLQGRCAPGAGWPRSDGLRGHNGRRTPSWTAGRRQRGGDLRCDRDQLPGARLHRPGVPRAAEPHPRQPPAVHLQLVHPGARQLQLVLLGEGGRRQPQPGARRRLVVGRCPGQLHEPGDPDAVKAFATKPPGSLLESMSVVQASLDTLLDPGTGQIVDLRQADPPAAIHDDADDASGWPHSRPRPLVPR